MQSPTSSCFLQHDPEGGLCGSLTTLSTWRLLSGTRCSAVWSAGIRTQGQEPTLGIGRSRVMGQEPRARGASNRAEAPLSSCPLDIPSETVTQDLRVGVQSALPCP